MARRNQGATAKRAVVKADNTSKALDLKRQGKSIREIARELGISVGYTHQIIEEGIAAIPAATRDALVAEIHERQLAVVDAHWKYRGDPKSAKVIQDSDKLLMDLLGLEAPKRSEITAMVASSVSPAEARKVMSELFPGNVGPTPDVASDNGAPNGNAPSPGAPTE